MHIPEKQVCDLCKAELTGPSTVMTYPLDETDRATIRGLMLPPSAPNALILGRLFDVAPHSWHFDFCRGCVDGLIPMLAELKTQAIAAWRDQHQRRIEAPLRGES